MKYSKQTDLDSFLENCEEKLLASNNRESIKYPSEYVGDEGWDSDRLIKKNNSFLSTASGVANVYAIFAAENGSNEYLLRYVGQTKKRYARERLKNHLFKKHEKTGSKLKDVTDHIKAGGRIKAAWINIEPESLRHFVEEELIGKCDPKWNKHSKKK